MKQAQYFRHCPRCNREIGHASLRAFKAATAKQQICMSCAKTKNIPLTRNCPKCNKLLEYTNVGNRQTAEKNKTVCFDCMLIERDYVGENNPFYGRKHTEEVKQEIRRFNLEERILSDEFIQQARANLANVSNDRPLYDIWLEKYGQEEANRRLEVFKKKQSENNTGEKNSMFGKPAPQGSGNGWSGWYKGWFFRSLRELSYMINVLEAERLSWKTPDKNFKIPYVDYAGQNRTYFPDFIVDGNRLVEIKPTKLHKSPKVLAKRKAAEEFCLSKNMIYELIDPIILSEEKIKQLYVSGQIKFLPKYDEKFKEKYL